MTRSPQSYREIRTPVRSVWSGKVKAVDVKRIFR